MFNKKRKCSIIHILTHQYFLFILGFCQPKSGSIYSKNWLRTSVSNMQISHVLKHNISAKFAISDVGFPRNIVLVKRKECSSLLTSHIIPGVPLINQPTFNCQNFYLTDIFTFGLLCLTLEGLLFIARIFWAVMVVKTPLTEFHNISHFWKLLL